MELAKGNQVLESDTAYIALGVAKSAPMSPMRSLKIGMPSAITNEMVQLSTTQELNTFISFVRYYLTLFIKYIHSHPNNSMLDGVCTQMLAVPHQANKNSDRNEPKGLMRCLRQCLLYLAGRCVFRTHPTTRPGSARP